MRDLTSRQEEILNLIKEWIETTGLPPTRMEIARHFGFSSPNAAEQHLKVLARKGALDLVPGTSRGIRLKGDGGVPLVGRVAAGSPILAQENIERHYQFDPAMFSPRADYLLTVHGMSMKDAGILDGDLLARGQVERQFDGAQVVYLDSPTPNPSWTSRPTPRLYAVVDAAGDVLTVERRVRLGA